MSLGRPIPRFEPHACPKCGAVQESPGSTVCEQCGTDLKLALVAKSTPERAVAPPRQPLRLGQLVGVPVRVLKRGFWTVQSLVSSILSLIWGFISLVLRIAIVLVAIGSIVVGLSYLPQVRASVPIMKEVPSIAKRWLAYAGVNGSKWLVSLAGARKAQQPQKQPPKQPQRQSQKKPQKKPAPATVAASQPLTVRSTPTGATVQLNARQVGKTPVTLKLAPGTYKLTISRSGYATVTRTITVRAGKTAALNVTLVARRQTPQAPRQTTPAPRPPSESPRQP